MFEERRRHQRIAISDVVLFRSVEGQPRKQFLEGRARDISRGGIFFTTTEPLDLGECIELAFRELNSPADTRAVAEVVRVDQTPDGYGIGARFTYAPVWLNELLFGQGVVR